MNPATDYYFAEFQNLFNVNFLLGKHTVPTLFPLFPDAWGASTRFCVFLCLEWSCWCVLQTRIYLLDISSLPLFISWQFWFNIFKMFISRLSSEPVYFVLLSTIFLKVILISTYWLLLRWVSRFIDLRVNIYQSNLQSIISKWNSNSWCSQKYGDNAEYVHQNLSNLHCKRL